MYNEMFFKEGTEWLLERFKVSLFYSENKRGRVITPEPDTTLATAFGWPIIFEIDSDLIN